MTLVIIFVVDHCYFVVVVVVVVVVLIIIIVVVVSFFVFAYFHNKQTQVLYNKYRVRIYLYIQEQVLSMLKTEFFFLVILNAVPKSSWT